MVKMLGGRSKAEALLLMCAELFGLYLEILLRQNLKQLQDGNIAFQIFRILT